MLDSFSVSGAHQTLIEVLRARVEVKYQVECESDNDVQDAQVSIEAVKSEFRHFG